MGGRVSLSKVKRLVHRYSWEFVGLILLMLLAIWINIWLRIIDSAYGLESDAAAMAYSVAGLCFLLGVPFAIFVSMFIFSMIRIRRNLLSIWISLVCVIATILSFVIFPVA